MTGRPPEELDAGAVRLRRWALDDIAALVAAVGESLDHLRPWMPWAQPKPGEEQAKFVSASIASFDRGEGFNYAIVTIDGGVLVGGCGLHRRTAADDALEIGYWVHARHTRRGYATAAAAALTGAAFELPGIHRVEIHCDEANEASVGVPKKLGFRFARQVQRAPEAPAETGSELVWTLERSAGSSPA